MCEIIGYIGNNKESLNIIKEKANVINLKEKIDFESKTYLGIGNTICENNVETNKINSHQHKSGKITIVYNGMIENYLELKTELEDLEYKFKSDTDIEVACTLLDFLYNINNNMNKTIEQFQRLAKGTYAIGIICEDNSDVLYAIKNDRPLTIGIGNNENYIASHINTIADFTNKYIILEDKEFARITSNEVQVYNEEGILQDKEIIESRNLKILKMI